MCIFFPTTTSKCLQNGIFTFPQLPADLEISFLAIFLYSTYTVTLRTLYLKIQILGGFFVLKKYEIMEYIYFVLYLYIRGWFNLFKYI